MPRIADCGCSHEPCLCESLDCPTLGVVSHLCPLHAAAPEMLQVLYGFVLSLADRDLDDDTAVYLGKTRQAIRRVWEGRYA